MKKDEKVMVTIIEIEERTVSNVAGHSNRTMIAAIQVDSIECLKHNQHQLADTLAVLSNMKIKDMLQITSRACLVSSIKAVA